MSNIDPNTLTFQRNMSTPQENSTPKKAKARQGMPFIMPDGRPLGAFLHDTNQIVDKGKRRKSKRGKKAAQWDASSRHTSATTAATATRIIALTELEKAELAALEKVGQRRQRRYLADKLLRDMTGPLTAKDMEGLFKPAPFGESHQISPFEAVTAPDIRPLWELFIGIDADKQARVLKKWEEHIRELRAEAAAYRHADNNNGDDDGAAAECETSEEGLARSRATTTSGGVPQKDPAAVAIASWSRVNHKSRKALRKAPKSFVHELELQIMDFNTTSQPGDQVELELTDGFQRLLGYGLAEFWKLKSFTKLDAASGHKHFFVQMPKNSTPTTAAAAGSQDGGSGVLAGTGAGIIEVTCLDIITVLEEYPSEHGLNVNVLRRAILFYEPSEDCSWMAAAAQHGSNAYVPEAVIC